MHELKKTILSFLRFSQGLRLRQIDMMDDDIAASSATLTKMAKKIREDCSTAVERMRLRNGQLIGGQREFVVIDESHFRHKRKVKSMHYLSKCVNVCVCQSQLLAYHIGQ